MKKLVVITLMLALFIATAVISVAGKAGKHCFGPPDNGIDPEDVFESDGEYELGVPGDDLDDLDQDGFQTSDGILPKDRF